MPAALRHIEPKPGGDIAVEVQDIQKSKRKVTKLACNNCRAKKIKCDGGRPECEPCKGRGSCVYENKNGQAQIQELRGGNEQLKHENEQLKHENEQRKHENEQLKHENEQLTCQMSRLESAIKSMLPADIQRAPEIPPEQQFMGSVSEEPSYAEQLTNTVLWPSLLAEQQPASPSQCPKGRSRAESDLRWNSSCPYGCGQLMVWSSVISSIADTNHHPL
ncbi:nitrate assimilation regulatory nirA [Apiospora arundinis]|uniref:Nitrate assimilation regulatory nirA n=1 Tax=Apiospora arundinis TaxID=335852 RepID=A0ABR2IWB5_9PEZI